MKINHKAETLHEAFGLSPEEIDRLRSIAVDILVDSSSTSEIIEKVVKNAKGDPYIACLIMVLLYRGIDALQKLLSEKEE